MIKTKIICTLGPATDQPDVLEQLVQEGMSVARFNFSHGNYEEHEARLNALREARTKYQKPVAALLDTKGPEIRVKTFAEGRVELQPDQLFRLCSEDVEGNQEQVSITCRDLYKDVAVGQRILLDDGLIEMNVEVIDGRDLVCRTVNGGVVSNNKGVNVPDVHLSLPYISDKDRQDILFGIEKDYDFIAASFVRCADDVKQIRQILNENGGSKIEIISKIENREGVDNIDEIIDASEGIMIARGDMGVEISPEQLPYLQKTMIRMCNDAFKPVITATQMLDSMIRNPRPTRAEVTDVANAIYDGTDAVMLSGETAMGKYPVEALSMMSQIAETTEFHLDHAQIMLSKAGKRGSSMSSAVAYASVSTAQSLSAPAIITPTISGHTPRIVSAFRPQAAIIATSPNAQVLRQMQLIWGVRAIYAPYQNGSDEVVESSVELAKLRGLVNPGELVVLTAGMTGSCTRETGVTNAMRVLTVE